MEKYSVEIVPKAEKEFRKRAAAIKARVREKILSLEENPRISGSKKLRETEFYRIRVGDYRAIYSIFDKEKVIKILSIGHRKEVYR
ncbi:MAG: type II toxin-antitoxin system RelE/ParE family toxin [Deltaproteobacteria bacterium]|nr:type II toxin-antitoxin system RelE/ParE family toxin [Deltaproteobacteria bacterium]